MTDPQVESVPNFDYSAIPELDVDVDHRMIRLFGHQLTVAFADWSWPEPVRTHDGYGNKLRRPRPASSGYLVFNVLTGENGWWVSVVAWPEGDMMCERPDEKYTANNYFMEPTKVLEKIHETAARTDDVREAIRRTLGDQEADEADPFEGRAHGDWYGWEPQRGFTEDEKHRIAALMREQFPTLYE